MSLSATSISTAQLRNVAIIAHVDHGKTTLVDQLLYQSGQVRDAELAKLAVVFGAELSTFNALVREADIPAVVLEN